MKLLVVSHPCVTPPNQQFFADVAAASGWALTLVVPRRWTNDYGRRGPERWPAYTGALRVLPVVLPGHVPLHVYRASFLPLLRQVRPDVIYVHNEPYAASTAQVFLANLLAGRRPFGFYSAQNILKTYPPPFRQLERMVLRRSRFAFPVSNDVAAVLRQKQFSGRTTVLPLSIDPASYRPHPDAAPLRRTLQTCSQEVIIGYLGRLTPEKGLLTLLTALNQLRGLPWRLVVAGSGPFEAPFRSEAARLDLTHRIAMVGYVPHEQAAQYLSAMDVLVLPSETQPGWREQFGRVLIEALACRTPVIGSDSGEIPALIRATGGGLVFPERDPAALAERLQQLILSPSEREALAERGQAAVLRTYTSPVLAHRFVETIREVLLQPA